MGHCPSLLGKDMVSLPEGTESPKARRATAFPPSVPGKNIFKIAPVYGSTSVKTKGRAVNNTSEVLLFAWHTLAISSFWTQGRVKCALELDYPPSFWSSPTHKITTSALLAALTALSIPERQVLLKSRSQPFS